MEVRPYLGARTAPRFRRDGQRSRLRGGIRPPSGRFVKAVDGDGQGVAPRAAVIVGHGIGEGVGQRVPGIQVLHGGQGIVEDVRVGAVGIEVREPYAPGSAIWGVKERMSFGTP